MPTFLRAKTMNHWQITLCNKKQFHKTKDTILFRINNDIRDCAKMYAKIYCNIYSDEK